MFFEIQQIAQVVRKDGEDERIKKRREYLKAKDEANYGKYS